MPRIDALPEPYLSEKAPNKGDPIPIIKTFNADAKAKSSLPVPKWSVIGRRYSQNECLKPKEISSSILPTIITKKGIILLLSKVVT